MWMRLDSITSQMKLKSIWYFIQEKGPYTIGEGEVTVKPNSSWADFNYTLAQGKRWPVGEYKVVVLSGTREMASGSFRIADAAQPEPQNWVGILSKGYQVSVIFDKVADSPESSRSLGTIKAGESYAIRYMPSSEQWQATGYNKGTKASGTWSYPGGKPENREFNIWGHVFRFDDAGRVFDERLGHVGHLILRQGTNR